MKTLSKILFKFWVTGDWWVNSLCDLQVVQTRRAFLKVWFDLIFGWGEDDDAKVFLINFILGLLGHVPTVYKCE